MNYHDYIRSPAWKLKRQARLEIDDHKCVVCKRGGIRLEVHHLHYENFGDEDVQNDLVTVCVKHHHFFDEIERWRRYEKRQHEPEIVPQIERRIQNNGMARSSLQVDLIRTNANAQRADCRPPQQMGEGD